MERKPKITGRPGRYKCTSGEGVAGYGWTPAQAWEWWRRGMGIGEPKLAPGLQKFVDDLYGDNLTKGEGRG